MSRKQPEIKVIYPDASTTAMLLTEAMIKRSSGKRVVETNSEEREYTGQELFSGALACKTDTSVELTLRLNPDAMDYALTTLIAKNLTEEERRAIRMETDSMELLDLLSPHAEAGASTCTDAVRSAPLADMDKKDAIDVPLLEAPREEKKIKIGMITESEMKKLFLRLMEEEEQGVERESAIEDAINDINDMIADAEWRPYRETKGTQSGEQDKQIEIGKMEAVDLRRIITDLQDDMVNHRGDQIEIAHRAFDAICDAAHMTAHDFAIETDDGIEEIKEDTDLIDLLAVLIAAAQRVTQNKTTDLKLYANEVAQYIRTGIPDDGIRYAATADQILKALESAAKDMSICRMRKPMEELEIQKRARAQEALKQDPSWEDVAAEARKIGQGKPCTKQSAAPLADTASGDEEAATLREAEDGEIEPGLLNDIETETEGKNG